MDATNTPSGESEDSWIFVAESLAVNYGSQEISPEYRGNQTEESDSESISIIGEGESEEQSELHAGDTDHCTENAIMEQDVNSRTLLQPCDEEQSSRDSQEELNTDIDLSSGTIKTYVHRNNNSLNTMLNVVLLGTVLTATGLAIGHMWGVQDDCTLHANTSITEVLYTLNKLQLENQFLRKRVTEMESIHLKTVTANAPDQVVHQKQTVIPADYKQSDLKIVTEEEKWRHIDDPTVISQMRKTILRDDFEEQMSRLNSIYNENKEWLDKEVVSRLRNEDKILKLTHSTVTNDGRIVPLKRIAESVKAKKISKNESLKLHSTQKYEENLNDNIVDNRNSIFSTAFIGPLSLEERSIEKRVNNKKNTSASKLNPHKIAKSEFVRTTNKDEQIKEKNPERKLYSDALKNHKKKHQKFIGKDGTSMEENVFSADQKVIKKQALKQLNLKRKNGVDRSNKDIQVNKIKIYNSDDDIVTKDRRYKGQKYTHGKKKDDRQKSFKKAKNENKYQQWEINRGYLKNEKSESTVSFDELPKHLVKNHFSQEWEIINNMNEYTDDLVKQKDFNEEVKSVTNESEFNAYNFKIPKRSKEYFRKQPSFDDWYSKMASGRREFRSQKQFANMLPRNKAQWYFEMMDSREHCRKQMKNVTKQCSNYHNMKKKMNYKNRR